ncbi:hypothetical protein HQ520_16335 [bacterium]|nr:hypothetical protein [bacterium]
MKQKIIGVYEMGYRKVQVVLRDGHGAEYWALPGDIDFPRMKIGMKGTWKTVLARVVHEAFEMSAESLRVRYFESQDNSGEAGNYLFVFTHCQFAKIADEVGEFMAAAVPDIAKACQKWNKKKRKAKS